MSTITSSDASPDLEDDRPVCATSYPRKKVEWLWPGRIPIGKLTLLVGDPGLGKSLLAIDAAARVTTATPWPDETTAEDGEWKGEGKQIESNPTPSTLPLPLRNPAPSSSSPPKTKSPTRSAPASPPTAPTKTASTSLPASPTSATTSPAWNARSTTSPIAG